MISKKNIKNVNLISYWKISQLMEKIIDTETLYTVFERCWNILILLIIKKFKYWFNPLEMRSIQRERKKKEEVNNYF